MAYALSSSEKRKKSDDIVSLDSWTEAISSPVGSADSESPVEKTFGLKAVSPIREQRAKDNVKSVKSATSRQSIREAQDQRNRVIKQSTDGQTDHEPLVLNPSNLISSVLPSSSSVLTSVSGIDISKLSSQHGYNDLGPDDDGFDSIPLNSDVLEQPDSGFESLKAMKSKEKLNHFPQKLSQTKTVLKSHVKERRNLHDPKNLGFSIQNDEDSGNVYINSSASSSRHQQTTANKYHQRQNLLSTANPRHITTTSRPSTSNNDSVGSSSEHFWHETLSNRLNQYPPRGNQSYPPRGSRQQSHTNIHKHLQDEEDIDQSEKVKNKVKSAWNNVIYGKFFVFVFFWHDPYTWDVFQYQVIKYTTN